MSVQPQRVINLTPLLRTKIKKEKFDDDDEDAVNCRICEKGFASDIALRNHVRMEHMEAYASGDSAVWTKQDCIKQNKTKKEENQMILKKTNDIISSMAPTSLYSLASNDVSYIIIKAEDLPKKKKKFEKYKTEKKDDKVIVVKKEKEAQPITGPFECLQPSTLVADGTCHQIFFSCCEYSVHCRDEHTRRRKGLRCQVCEKPLACQGEEQMAPFACVVCGVGFQTSQELSDHSAVAHVKLKPYECSVCHKRFTQQGGVFQHMRMHTGDRPFPCTFCPKAFTQKSGLDQHLRIHTKVKPYRCIVCSKSFCQSIHLKQHMRTHTNVAPFQCGICEKRFKQSSHLNYHLKNHNPANLTVEQQAKYAELIGLINKEIVVMDGQTDQEVGEDQEGQEIDEDQEGQEMEEFEEGQEVEEVQEVFQEEEVDMEQVIAEQSIQEDSGYILPDDETWCIKVSEG